MKRLVIGAVLATVLGLAPSAWAQEKAVQAARKLLAEKQEALVRVSAVVKTEGMGMGIQLGHGDEQKSEAMGTVVDKCGLTVVSYSSLDPMSAMSGAIKIRMGGGEGQELKIKTELSEVKVRLADGTELPATLVLKDADLDLAFVLPKKPEGAAKSAQFASVDLGNAAASAAVLDDIVTLGRLGQSLDYQASAGVGQISAVVKKPRPLFVVGANPGGPVFTAEGKLLGISILRMGGRGGMLQMLDSALVTVPAKDVQELAQQALAKAKDAAKEEQK